MIACLANVHQRPVPLWRVGRCASRCHTQSRARYRYIIERATSCPTVDKASSGHVLRICHIRDGRTRARIRFDPWQAALLAQGLQANGVKVEEVVFDPAKNGRRALTLHTLLRDHRIAIYQDENLIDELMNVQLRETSPGVYRIDHQSGHHDDRVISLALCAEWLVSRPQKKRHDPSELGKALGRTNRHFWRPSPSKPR